MASENIVRTDVECHRCNATSEAEVDISEELAQARREALEEAAKEAEAHHDTERLLGYCIESNRCPICRAVSAIRALASASDEASDGEPGGG